jgi:hypothetical protein
MKNRYIRERAIFYKRPLLTRIWEKHFVLIAVISGLLLIISKLWANGFKVAI